MKFSLITPYLPSEYDQLLALKTNLMAQTTTDFEWLIAGTLPIDLDQTEWQAPFTIRQVHPKASTVGAAATPPWLLLRATGWSLLIVMITCFQRR
ncbi:hypothetical protein ACN50C_00220 [Levilactobacillus brevis]|uniref:Uncharacterized protein n=1 Tax=Levilactobacillus brevis KB290 TaxID=1001583 RepID=M5ACI9_LEVBR|nr:hypothetical protein [Levilactobacillus brevis]ULH74735.1 hypothetical protein MD222_01955 [Levilactobacillus brevis]BAN06027.1 hypothetical protein LVISKB_0392 [Levilactobacillus brevis KB290]